ncbi:MAG TPA: response regulator, partial [Kofleriaceae bacterium]|nr:response regulator [Kofleriaceae bacterium]
DAREPVTLFVEYEGADDLVGDFTDNLVSGSTFVATNRELPVGARVQLVLSFPGLLEPISVEGSVQWTRAEGTDGDAGASIEFAPGAVRDLAPVVEQIRQRDPRLVSRIFEILMAEDNRHVATLIQEGLRGSARRDYGGSISFVFRNVEDGRAAVEMIRREPFHALIIDVYLPILDGPKVIQQVRTELGLAELPIIAMSGGGDPARRAALDAGANVFLDKPVRLRQIIDAIKRLLAI